MFTLLGFAQSARLMTSVSSAENADGLKFAQFGQNQTFAMKPENWPVSATVDYVKVGREAHELALRHGRDAHRFALRMSQQAKDAGDAEAAAFWYAVNRTLEPRA